MLLFSLTNVVYKNLIYYPNIEIAENSTTFICGESGSGKSTLLKLLNGVVSADSGEILYAGNPIEEYDPVIFRREVLLCGQSAYLFDGNIRDNFSDYYKYRELSALSTVEIMQYLKICAAEFSLDTNCAKMSGGERQRIFTAICLSMRPKVLLLDEPTSALDDETSNMVMKNIKNFCNKNTITLIVVSHNKALSEIYADSTVLLEGGSRSG
jgi:putative ABC transport system ATP-binding protein